MAIFLRYLFFQIPGWAITAIAAVALVEWEIIPRWLALLGFGGLVLKDLVSFPFLRSAYEGTVTSGSEALIGRKGIAQGDLAPEGYVKIHLELWRAVAEPSRHTIPAGTEVEVVRAEGMRLVVRTAREKSSV
ncbi:MAG TPA: NfeD family protein [Candidatus Binatia bacterium]|nr:NfeD family protein [Candidatus Binatia bacterium]